jgi:hypothetical protein
VEALIGKSGVTSSQAVLHDAASFYSLIGKGRGLCVPIAVCYSGGRAQQLLCRGVERLDDVIGLGRLDDATGLGRDGEGLDEAEKHWGARALVL